MINKVYAKSKYVGHSPRKTRLVVDMLRGQNAFYASQALAFVRKAPALPVKKTLDAAIANAIENEGMDRKELTVVEARVDEAPTFKRGRAVSKGRYHQILKRNCHIIIAVSDGSEKTTKAKKQTAPKAAATKKAEKSDKKEVKSEKKNVKSTKAIRPDAKLSRKSQVKTGNAPRVTQAKGV